MSKAPKAWIVLVDNPLMSPESMNGNMLIDETIDSGRIIELREDIAGDSNHLREILESLAAVYGKERPHKI